MEQILEYFAQAVPSGWFSAPPAVTCDRDEVVVIGWLAPDVVPGEFREQSRPARMGIAAQAEARFGRKVSWGVTDGERTLMFTHLNVPVMTRLRIDERAVLDALIDGGLARSRSEALAWCVRLVAKHQRDWLSELREAADTVRAVREKGPS